LKGPDHKVSAVEFPGGDNVGHIFVSLKHVLASMLELNNVSKRVGNDDHISDISLTFDRGSINVLLGPTLGG